VVTEKDIKEVVKANKDPKKLAAAINVLINKNEEETLSTGL
jgi:hypothetical protein